MFGGSGILVLYSILASGLPFVLVLLVVVFLWRRDELDPRGLRPYVTYVFAVTFVSVVVMLVGVGVFAAGVSQKVAGNDNRFGTAAVTAQATTFPPPGFSIRPVPVPTFRFTIPPIPHPSLVVVPPSNDSAPLVLQQPSPSSASSNLAVLGFIIATMAGGLGLVHAGLAQRALREEIAT